MVGVKQKSSILQNAAIVDGLRFVLAETRSAGSFPEYRLLALPGFGRIHLAKFLTARWIEEANPTGYGHWYCATDLAEAEFALRTRDIQD